jgi:uncharacterized membrane protein YhiD involved in acid resistance
VAAPSFYFISSYRGRMKDKELVLSVIAIAIYLVGGLGTFVGAGLVLFMKGLDLWGWGEGHTIGYLLIAVGLCLTVLGVLIMRVLRNRV